MSTRPLLDAHAIIARWLGPRAASELLELVRERSTFTLCRYSGCVQARRTCVLILREGFEPGHEQPSFPEIAAALGFSSHSTAMSAYRAARHMPEVISIRRAACPLPRRGVA